MRVALLSPGAADRTSFTQFQAAFVKVMRCEIDIEYISETEGGYHGVRFTPIREFDARRYDVVHFQWGNSPLHLFEFSTLLKISKRSHRPLIVSTLHEAELGFLIGASEHAWRYRWLFKSRFGVRGKPNNSTDYAFFSHYTVAEILKRSDQIIVHSEYTKRRIISEHQLCPTECEKIHVARLGIDWNDYSAGRGSDQSSDEMDSYEPMILLYVGSLYAIKSVDKILKALHLVQHFGRRDDFYFVIVGIGPEREYLNYMAEGLIPGCYCFAGGVPDVLPYYDLAHVVICSRAFSRGETSGLIPQACGAGKPIILPNIGGWAEYINSDRGFVVDADDEIEYALTLLHCLRNRQELKEKGINARRFAAEMLSWQAQRRFFLSLYEQAFSSGE